MSNNIGNLRINGINPLSYMGVNPYTPTPFFFKERRPTINDFQNFILGTLWLYTIETTTPETFEVWMLASMDGGIATWIELYPGVNVGTVRTLTGNTGLPVGPDVNGNINTIGDITVGITVAGDPGTNTTTITSTGGGPFGQTITGNTGGPVRPDISGNWNVVGDGTGITIAGNAGSHMLTASLVGGGVASQKYFTDMAGPVVPNAAGEVNVFGAAGITTSGSGNTITIAGSASGTTITNGTFTPAISIGGSQVGITYANQAGEYTLINNGVDAYVQLNISITLTSKGGLTGILNIENLPFSFWSTPKANNSTALFSGLGVTLTAGFTIAWAQNSNLLPSATSLYCLQGSYAGGSFNHMSDTNISDGASFGLAISYRCTPP